MPFQKDVNVNPTIASVGDPPPPDTSKADAIETLGGAVRTFVLEKKKNDFLEELEGLGDPSNVRAISDSYLSSKKEFDRLKRGLAQGALTQTHVNIAAEALLKEAIGSTPALAPELRRYAATQLGFDPTGAHIRALLDSTVPAEQEENPILKNWRQTAEALNTVNGTPMDATMKLQGRILAAKNNADLITHNAAIGAAGRIEIFNASLQEYDGYVADAMKEIVFDVHAGGITNPESVKAIVMKNISAQKAALRSRYVEAGIPADSTSMAKDFAQVDEQWKHVLALVDEGSFDKIVTRHGRELTQLMAIEGMSVMGDIAMMNQIGGQAAVEYYFKTLDKYKDKDQFDLLKRNNPAFARYAESIDDVTIMAADVFKRVMGRAPQFDTSPRFSGSPVLDQEKEAAMAELADKVGYNLIGNPAPPEVRDKLVNYVKNHGQQFKMVGAYAQKGARANASEAEVEWMTNKFKTTYPELVVRVAGGIQRSPGFDSSWQERLDLVTRNGKLGFMHTNERRADATKFVPVDSVMGKGLASIYGGQELAGDLIRLNAFAEAARNGWADDFEVDPNTFIQKTFTSIMDQSMGINQAIEAYENDASIENLEAIRAIDPALVSAVEGAGGSDSAQ